MNTHDMTRWNGIIHVAKMAPSTGCVVVDSAVAITVDSALRDSKQQREELLAALIALKNDVECEPLSIIGVRAVVAARYAIAKAEGKV